MKPTPHFLHTVKKAAVLWKALLRTLTLGGRASGLREQNQVGICPGCAGNHSQHPQEAAWGELEWSCEEGRGQGRPVGQAMHVIPGGIVHIMFSVKGVPGTGSTSPSVGPSLAPPSQPRSAGHMATSPVNHEMW